MQSEVAAKADFSEIRYAQCWEDADILLEALNIQPTDTCLSIASAGDNALAMVSKGPAQVIAIDLNPAQLCCLALRVAAYQELDHDELLELIGSRPSSRRQKLYQRCRGMLSADDRAFWDAHAEAIDAGIGSAGKFERYFSLFRTRIMPLIHSRQRIDALLQAKNREAREAFYTRHWDNWRWRLLFRLFFSRTVMGRLGRDPNFFAYVQGNVAERILDHTRYALSVLDTAANPYLQWILTGRHTTALPYALRAENFEAIRDNLHRLEWRCQSLEALLGESGERVFDKFNLSDIFEYMSPENYRQLLTNLADAGRPGGRLAYWNMLVDRHRPDGLSDRLLPLTKLAEQLYRQDKAFFYSAFVVEEIR